MCTSVFRRVVARSETMQTQFKHNSKFYHAKLITFSKMFFVFIISSLFLPHLYFQTVKFTVLTFTVYFYVPFLSLICNISNP